MTGPDFDLTDEELRATGSMKWTWAGPDVLPAWVAEMDVRPAPVVAAAVRDAVERGAYGYPAADRLTGLPEATAGFVARRFGWAADPEHVLLTGDVMSGARFVIETLCEDAPVVVPTPSYPPFLHVVPLTGRELVEVPFAADGARRVLDLDRIGRAFAAGARTLLLANPHNPLGRVFTRPELEALRDLADRHGARVISDEIHAPLLLPGATFTPWATVAEDPLVLLAASKAWNVPGLKCAQIVVPGTRDRKRLLAAPHVANHGTSPLGIVAAVAAYEHGEPWLDGVLTHLDARRRQLTDLLATHLPGVAAAPLEATYLAWLGPVPTPDPATTALQRGRVMVNAGDTFGHGFAPYVRLNIATSAERLDRIVHALATAWPPP